MTIKMINTMDKKPINQIEQGTWVKKDGSMYIVSKVSEAQFNLAVDEALFGARYASECTTVKSPMVYNPHQLVFPRLSDNRERRTEEARRDPEHAKFVLINISTGNKFYPEFLTLQELMLRISNAGFEVVENVEIKEVN